MGFWYLKDSRKSDAHPESRLLSMNTRERWRRSRISKGGKGSSVWKAVKLKCGKSNRECYDIIYHRPLHLSPSVAHQYFLWKPMKLAVELETQISQTIMHCSESHCKGENTPWNKMRMHIQMHL